MIRKCITLLLFSLLALCEAMVIDGPFRETAAAFFFVHKGGPLKLALRFAPRSKKTNSLYPHLGNDAAMVGRIFDAEENLVAWDYIRVKQGAEGRISHDFGEAPKGIYQIRYSGYNLNTWPVSEPQTSFGIMPMRCVIHYAVKDQFDNAYFYIPENAEKMSLYSYNAKLSLTDEAGAKHEFKHGTSPVELNGKQGQIWQLNCNIPCSDFSFFGFNGMPVILCPDKETAAAIHGSLEKASDGTLYPHKFQVRMHEWIQKHRNDDLSMQHVDIKSVLPLMKKEPRTVGLLGPWGLFNHINSMIEQQNIDKNSPQFCESPYLQSLAVALGMDKEYNPFFKNPVLEKRVVIGAFKELMTMKESDTREDVSGEYCGADALSYAHVINTFYNALPGVSDEECRKLWCDAIRRTPDRFSMFRVSCDNQSSHWPFFYQCLAERLGEKKYEQLAKDYIFGMSREGGDRFMKTGYQQEAYGADGTYQGLGTCYQAIYYRMSGNPVAKNTLRIIYDFYNHSVAPEMDGTVYGCSNYGHRTAGSWVFRQYGGGLSMMQGELPEAAVWFRNQKPESIDEAVSSFREVKCSPGNGAKYATAVHGPFYSKFMHPCDTLPDAKFPLEASSEFTKNFNNEFIAVRRPKYYAFTYIGHTSGNKQRNKMAEYKHVSGKWACSQGMGLLWFQNYGSVITAMNWDGNTGYFLRADLKNGECAYPEYLSTKEAFDGKKITLSHKLFNQDCVSVKRTISFLDDGISQRLDVDVSKENNIKDLYEQLPLLVHNVLNLEYMVDGKWQDTPGKASKIRLNGTILITLEGAFQVSLGPATTRFDQKIQPLRIHLGSAFKPGDKVKLSYTITK